MSNYTNTSPLTSDVSEVHGLIGVGGNNSSVLLDPFSIIPTAANSSTIDIDLTSNVISASIIPSSISSTHLSSTLLTTINKGDTAIQPSSLGVQVQAFNSNLQSISNIDSGIGFLKRLSDGSWELDNNNYESFIPFLSLVSNTSTDGVLARVDGEWDTYQSLDIDTTGLSGGVSNPLTFISGGGGVSPGNTFDGSSPLSISYNSIGAPSVLGDNASGTWNIDINGNSSTSTLAATATLALSCSGAGVAKAWINFKGTGTIAVRSSNNISSITDNGTGSYTLNFIEPMGRTDYCVVVSTDSPGIIATATSLLANSVNIRTSNTSSLPTDVSSIHVVVFA